MDDLDDIIEEFLVESYENLDRLDVELVELEENPTSGDLLRSIFRNVHTIKGTSGFFGFDRLESVSHAGENLLSLLRDGKLELTTDIANALLATVDAVRSMLDTVRDTKTDGDDPHSELVATLHRLSEGEDANVEAAAPAVELEVSGDEVPAEVPVSEDRPAEDRPAEDTGAEQAPMVEEQTPAEEPAPVEEAAPAAESPAAPPPAEASTNPADASIRVDVGLLDRLMNLVGELVLARNRVLQYQMVAADLGFQSTSQQLDHITTELQEGVMKTRMQPIGNVWSKLPRVVRDLAASCSKKVRLEMEGEDTELDKTILEAIKDPLTHIVRNSVDHGLESPEERVAAGKPEVGTLKLRALHEGGQVVIEIIDDGGGLNLERIKAKAVDQSVVTPQQASSMSDRDASNLIFRAGFSTATAVTNVSGRGVGMDVVKTNVEKIGGSIEVQSQPGQGTTLIIKIPLTLAIIPALIVTADADRYLIPQINLLEVLYVDGSSRDIKIEKAGDAPVLRLRGTLLPMVSLRSVLGLPESTDDGDPIEVELASEPLVDSDVVDEVASPVEAEVVDEIPPIVATAPANGDGVSIAVLDADGLRFGLVVDDILDTEEIVVKPLSPHVKSLGAFAGTTIMGDGAVSLILDASGIARLGDVYHDEERPSGVEDDKNSAGGQAGETALVLVCTIGTGRIGIPLAMVSRLEELPSDQIELASGHDVIQYRGRLLRLIYLEEALEPGAVRSGDQPELLQVLVYETDLGVYGLVVDEILDVFEADLTQGEPADRTGLSMTGIIGRRATDLLDVDEIIGIAGGASLLVGAGSMS